MIESSKLPACPSSSLGACMMAKKSVMLSYCDRNKIVDVYGFNYTVDDSLLATVVLPYLIPDPRTSANHEKNVNYNHVMIFTSM